MSTTVELIRGAVQPLHEVIRETNDENLIARGLKLGAWLAGARDLSADLNLSSLVQVETTPPELRSFMKARFINASIEASRHFIDRAVVEVQSISDNAEKFPLVQKACERSIETLYLIADNNGSIIPVEQHAKSGNNNLIC